MIVVVNALVGAAFIVLVGGLVAYLMLVRLLKRHGLPTPNDGDWSWIRASYPPDVHRARLWAFVCILLFLVCIIAAATLSEAFDLCPGCVFTSSPA